MYDSTYKTYPRNIQMPKKLVTMGAQLERHSFHWSVQRKHSGVEILYMSGLSHSVRRVVFVVFCILSYKFRVSLGCVICVLILHRK